MMKYFAYGSNMSLPCLKKRVPSAEIIGIYSLEAHELQFHKISKDGSGKCDIFYTGDKSDIIFGLLYEINEDEKNNLDRAEGLGYGYDEKEVIVSNFKGDIEKAVTYYATNIDDNLNPFSWYKAHVLYGAKEAKLPKDYILKIEAVVAEKDSNKKREKDEMAIYDK